MNEPSPAKSDFIPNDVLVRYRRLNEQGWKRILDMTDVLVKAVVDLSIASEEQEEFNPYDTSSRLKRLSA